MLLSGDGGGFPFAFLLLNKEGIANNVAAKRKQSGKHRPMVTHSDFLILHEFPSREIEAKWREFLEDVECPAHFNAPEYFVEPYWDGKRPFAILALHQSRVVGVLTGVHEGEETVSGLQSRPQVCLAKSADPAIVGDALARGLLAEGGNSRLITLYGWNWTPLDALKKYRFRRREMEGCVVLDCTLGAEALFKQFSKTRRYNIRLAMREGVEVFQATTREEFQTYYEIYLSWCRRKNITPFPYEMEEKAFFATRNNRRLFLARSSGKIIAGSIIRFFPGGLSEYARNNSLPEFLRLNPNDLIQWRAIEWLCQQGIQRHSMGGAHAFLQKFGGVMTPIYRYRLDRTLLRRHDLREALRDRGRATLKKLPAPVEKAARRFLGA